MNALGGGGVDLGQPPVQMLGPVLGGLGAQPRAEGTVRGRPLEEPLGHRLQVERGAAGEERDGAARCDLLDGAFGALDVQCRAEVLAGIGHVDHVVRHLLPPLGRRLRGADVHPPVDLHRVERDNLCAGRLRQRERGGALAARGLANNE